MQAYFGARDELLCDVDLSYVKEREPLGTAGSLALVEGLDDTFLVLNGDLLTDIDFHDAGRSPPAVRVDADDRRAAAPGQVRSRHAASSTVTTGSTGYIEKPEQTYDVSMGVYVYEPSRAQPHQAGRVSRLSRPGACACSPTANGVRLS